MTKEELQNKQQEALNLSMEIARLRKILGIKQSAFNKVDKEIYEFMKSQEDAKNDGQPIGENN